MELIQKTFQNMILRVNTCDIALFLFYSFKNHKIDFEKSHLVDVMDPDSGKNLLDFHHKQ